LEGGRWKLISPEGRVFLRVKDFPVPKGSSVEGESLWVEKLSGTDEEGSGRINDNPVFFVEASRGGLVRYAGGTDAQPTYVGLLSLPEKS
jgi:hypothetical protein